MYEFIWSSIYRVSIFLVRLFPRCFIIKSAEIVALIYYLLALKSRKVLQENLKEILNSEYREKYVFNTFRNFACYLVDFMRVRDNNEKFFKRYFKIENKDLIDEGFRNSKGGIIGLSMHLGNWELGGGYLAFLNYQMSAVALDHSVAYIDKFFKNQRKRLKVEPIPFRNSFNISKEKLKERRILALLCDRDFTGKFIKGKFFGKNSYLSKAPFLLSLRAEVPIVFGVTVREGYYYRVIMEGPFSYERYLSLEMDTMVSKVIKLMEKFIRAYPDQWFFFQRFWEKPETVAII